MVLDHVNLGNVHNFMADPLFGKVTFALSAAQIQLEVRLSF